MSADEQREFLRLMQADVDRMERTSSDANRAAMMRLEAAMADKFRVLREERGWSQSDLSQRLKAWGFDLHQTTIAKLEAGKRPLRVAEMFALAHVFRLPAEAVFLMAHDPDSEDVGYDAMSEQLGQIDDVMTKMRETYRESLERSIETLGMYQTQRNELVRAMRASARENGDDHGQHPAAS